MFEPWKDKVTPRMISVSIGILALVIGILVAMSFLYKNYRASTNESVNENALPVITPVPPGQISEQVLQQQLAIIVKSKDETKCAMLPDVRYQAICTQLLGHSAGLTPLQKLLLNAQPIASSSAAEYFQK